MAHAEQMSFVESVRFKYPDHFRNCAVLEVGSRNVNGSVRQFFGAGCSYVGIDCTPGPDVNEVCLAHEYVPPKGFLFDTIISCEAFEHDPYLVQSITNVMRYLRIGGLFVATMASPLRQEHGTRRANNPEGTFGPDPDYYRGIGAAEFVDLIYPFLDPHTVMEVRSGLDVYAHGIRVPTRPPVIVSNR